MYSPDFQSLGRAMTKETHQNYKLKQLQINYYNYLNFNYNYKNNY